LKTNSPAEIIRLLGLARHPEGGWYRESYRSAEKVASMGLPPRFGGERAFSTAIYFLLERGDFSSLHRLKSDEVWHFYCGSSLTVRTISPAGEVHSFVLGSDLTRGEVFQEVVPAGFWFGAEVTGEGPYSLVGCTVAPGFDFADFELGSRAELLEMWPAHSGLIRGLTRE
jgi:predicted cupin superfamily sugar epimerase